jgi:hypothetical protein
MSERTFDGAAESSDGEMEVAANVPSFGPANGDCTEANSGECTDERDLFAGSAEDVAADETRRRVELFAWADNMFGLSGADLELALDDAVKRFKGKAKEEAKGSRAESHNDNSGSVRRRYWTCSKCHNATALRAPTDAWLKSWHNSAGPRCGCAT